VAVRAVTVVQLHHHRGIALFSAQLPLPVAAVVELAGILMLPPVVQVAVLDEMVEPIAEEQETPPQQHLLKALTAVTQQPQEQVVAVAQAHRAALQRHRLAETVAQEQHHQLQVHLLLVRVEAEAEAQLLLSLEPLELAAQEAVAMAKRIRLVKTVTQTLAEELVVAVSQELVIQAAQAAPESLFLKYQTLSMVNSPMV